MLDLDADILCEGHFGIYRGKDKVQISDFSFLFAPRKADFKRSGAISLNNLTQPLTN